VVVRIVWDCAGLVFRSDLFWILGSAAERRDKSFCVARVMEELVTFSRTGRGKTFRVKAKNMCCVVFQIFYD
jgi:hypothetical protein